MEQLSHQSVFPKELSTLLNTDDKGRSYLVGAAFVVGSRGYRLDDDESDYDLMIVVNDDSVDRIPNLDAQAGPMVLTIPVRPEIHCRVVGARQMMEALVEGRRWAWELPLIGIGPNELVIDNGRWELKLKDQLAGIISHLKDLVLDESLFLATRSLRVFEEYESIFLPHALSAEPFQHREDYALQFNLSGWHHKVGYYLMLELLFRESCCRGYGSCIPSSISSTKGFMLALKRGEIKQKQWYEIYQQLSASLKKKLGSDILTVDPSLVESLAQRLFSLANLQFARE